MKRTIIPVFSLFCASLLLLSCSFFKSTVVLSGEAVFRERIALVPGSLCIVSLHTADRPHEVIALDTISPASGVNPFLLEYSSKKLKSGERYALTAAVYSDGVASFSMKSPVIVKATEKTTQIELMMEQEAEEGATTTALFTDSEWRIAHLYGEKLSSPLNDGRHPLIRFLEGRYSATVGCNWVNGAVEFSGAEISFRLEASTMMFCVDLVEQEKRLHQALTAAQYWKLDSEERLHLLGETGALLMTLQKSHLDSKP